MEKMQLQLPIKLSSENIKAMLVSFSMVYFFSPINFVGQSEIYPWYYLITFLIWPTYQTLGVFIAGFMATILVAFFDMRVALELAQVIVVITFLFWYAKLSRSRLSLIVVWIQRLLLFLTLLMVFQKIFPSIFGPMGALFSSRELGITYVDSRSGAVRGIAPEQSYMAMTIIGIAVAIWLEKGFLSGRNQLLVKISIFMCSSIIGFGAWSCLIILCNLSNRAAISASMKRLFVNKLFFTKVFLTLLISASLVYFFLESFLKSINRFIQFIEIMRLSWDGTLQSILFAEKKFGSDRLQELLLPLSELCCGLVFSGEFHKSFSLYGSIWEFFAPLHLLLLYFVFKGKLSSIKMLSIIYAVFFGPVLIVTAYLGLIERRSNV